jgi:hypothetical protein
MKHVTALLIKYAMIALVLEIVLSILTHLTFVDILYISLIVTLFAYIIGDLLILSASNNIVATVADTGLALFIIYMFNYLWDSRPIDFSDALVAAVVIGAGEWFFHKYVASKVFPPSKMRE